MNLIKRHIQIPQLEIHFKNLHEEVNKIIVQHSDINFKMYSYNFEKIALKFQKFVIDFIGHLSIKQNLYHFVEKIKSISHSLNQASKDHQARSSRTYQDDQSFRNIGSGLQFPNPLTSETQFDDQKQIDQIEQFMMKRNHELQSNIFGDVDEGFKMRQRSTLEQFLSHADVHAKNIQVQLKNSSQQRKKMSNSFKIGGMQKNKLLFKKQTFDLQRINQLTNNFGQQSSSNSTIYQSQTQEKQIQTVFTGQNIQWNKILTYCLKKKTFKNDSSCHEQNEINQFNEIFDPQIFGSFQLNLIDCEAQTKFEQVEKTSKKVQVKKQVQKKMKANLSKIKSTQKRTKTKQKQSKVSSFHTKTDEIPQNNVEKSIVLTDQNTISKEQQKQQKVLKNANLNIFHQLVNQQIHFEAPKNLTNSTFQVITSPSKKQMKPLQLRELIFQFTSKKQLNKKAGIENPRNQKKKKSMNIYYGKVPNQKNQQNRGTINEIELVQRNTIFQSEQERQNQRCYETTVNIQEGLVRRKLSKKNTWKQSTSSSNSILKSNSKLRDTKTDQHIVYIHDNSLKNKQLQQANQKQNQIDQDSSKIQKKSKIQRRVSNFAQMYGENIKNSQKKQNFSKRNTLDTLIRNNEFKNQFAPCITQSLSPKNQFFQNLIQQQQFETSYRNTQQKIETNIKISQLTTLRNDQVKKQLKNIQIQIQKQTIANNINAHVHDCQLQLQKQQSKKYKTQKKILKQPNLKQISRINTLQIQKSLQVKQHAIQRNSSTIHEHSHSNHIFAKNKRKHMKHCSQDLPNLSNCKQKLSDIKNTLHRQAIKKTRNQSEIFASLANKNSMAEKSENSKEQKSKYIKNTTQKISPCTTTPQYRSFIKTQTHSVQQEQNIIETIRRLLLTKSYRDRLLLYLSMIEVTHEKYCGKNCQHVKKFITNMTGGIEVENQTVAKQLLKLYNSKSMNNLQNLNFKRA